MALSTLIFQIFLAIPLTIILGYFQNKENRRLNQILLPTIYIIIISALIPIVKENVFLIVIFEIFIRNFYLTTITNQNYKISNLTFILESFISISLSLFTYNYFINKVESVIPNPEDIKPFIWFLIILYIFSLYKISNKENKKDSQNKQIIRKKEHIIMQYAKFKNIYSSIIKSKNIVINNLIYAIMINNNYKRPKIYRDINSYIGSISKKETAYGIMQVKSLNHLTDEESIKLTLKSFEQKLKNTKISELEQINKLLKDYKDVEQNEIKNNLIYKNLKIIF